MSKQGFKGRKNPIDQIHEALESFANRFTLSNPRFSERYLKSEGHLIIHFCVRGVDEEYVACFQRTHLVLDTDMVVQVHAGESGVHLTQNPSDACTEIKASVCRTDHDQRLVFVGNVQFVEHPECMTLPALIRFDGIDKFYRHWSHSAYFSGSLGFVVSFPAAKDREIGSLGRDGKPARRSSTEGVSQMIQGATEVLDRVAADGGQDRRRGTDRSYIIDQLSRLRVVLSSNDIWLASKKGAFFGLKITDVLFGPVNLDPDLLDRLQQEMESIPILAPPSCSEHAPKR
jgi:hypothetical protein